MSAPPRIGVNYWQVILALYVLSCVLTGLLTAVLGLINALALARRPPSCSPRSPPR